MKKCFWNISFLFRLFAALAFALVSLSSIAQPVVPIRVCNATDFWADCALKVKKAIKSTNDPAVALEAAAEWAERYTELYAANSRDTWTPTDQEMLEEAMKKLWDEAVGKYLDPAGLALSLGLLKYFPKLAATLELAGSAPVAFFVTLLAPSPIANDFTAALADNKEINELLMQKLPALTSLTIKDRYPELFRQGFQKAKGQAVLP